MRRWYRHRYTTTEHCFQTQALGTHISEHALDSGYRASSLSVGIGHCMCLYCVALTFSMEMESACAAAAVCVLVAFLHNIGHHLITFENACDAICVSRARVCVCVRCAGAPIVPISMWMGVCVECRCDAFLCPRCVGSVQYACDMSRPKTFLESIIMCDALQNGFEMAGSRAPASHAACTTRE